MPASPARHDAPTPLQRPAAPARRLLGLGRPWPRRTVPGLSSGTLFGLFVVLAAGSVRAAAASPAPGAAAAPNACGLFDNEAVAQALGAGSVDARAGRRDGSGLEISTCYLRAGDSARAVSVELRSSGATTDARRHWRTLFDGEDAASEPEAERESENEERRFRRAPGDPSAPTATPPAGAVRIERLGDEAYFIGTAAYGALYVLRGDVYLRLSVGGAGDLDTKLELARALALLALRRLDFSAADPPARYSAVRFSDEHTLKGMTP